MLTDLIDNHTRREITLSLKKKGHMSVDELSKEVGITPMGVRQHLLVLERNGIVEYITKKQGVGRPGFLYRLTGKADGLFPNQYADFSLDVLQDIEEKKGREGIVDIFSRRKDRILNDKIKTFSGKKLSDRVSRFVEMLKDEGEIVELEEKDTHFTLKKFTCPLPKVAAKYNEACAYDVKLFQELVGKDLTMQESIAEGAPACVYHIPK